MKNVLCPKTDLEVCNHHFSVYYVIKIGTHVGMESKFFNLFVGAETGLLKGNFHCFIDSW